MMHDGAGWSMGAWMTLWALVPVLIVVLVVVLLVRPNRGSHGPSEGPANSAASIAPPAAAVDSSAPSPPRPAQPQETQPVQAEMLEPDQRALLALLGERGGEAPQGDLVTLSGFSKSKVSKALDRLEAKGLVVRLRRGMSNRVVLARSAAEPAR